MSPERALRRITGLPRGIISIIPLRAPLDVLRGITIQIGGGGLPGGIRRVSRRPTVGKSDWSNIVEKSRFNNPRGRKEARAQPRYEEDNRIGWAAEIVEDYDNNGNLGIILEFTGIGLTKASFLRSRHYKPDSPVFYIPIEYNKRRARLLLATRGDILKSQIVPAQMDVNPFFQEELYLPQLTTTHDPASMTIVQNNGLVIVGYNPRAG